MKKLLKCLLITISLLALNSITVLAVDGEDIFTPPIIIPPSPNAASLGNYGQIPVGLFTGTPQISIPLYTINAKEISLPISLNYSSNGIRVDERSSDVGLGWSLQAGGVITRSLYDDPDEITTRAELPNLFLDSEEMRSYLSGTLSSNLLDTQADIFSFNFNGYSGKFYLDNTMTPKLISPAPLKIEKQPGFEDSESNDYSFKITTPDGVIYWFGGENASELAYTKTEKSISFEVKNAWYLKKITLLNNDEINFIYDNNWIISAGGISQNITAGYYYEDYTSSIYTPAQHELPEISTIYSKASTLNKIIWENGEVKFSYSQRFSVGDTDLKKIDTIAVYNNDGDLLKRYLLNYLEANCDLSFQLSENTYSPDPTTEKRLFLEKITDITNSINNINPYIFDYYSPNGLPPRLSYAQDYWGYFNGKNNPDLVTNDVSQYNQSSYEEKELTYGQIIPMYQNVGGDKNADGEFGIKGLIKKITYPTGGYNEFEYEPHSIYGVEYQNPSSYAQIALSVSNDEDDFTLTTDTYTTESIPFRQERIPVTFGLSRVCGEDDPIHDYMNITVRDVETNNDIPFKTYNSTTGQYNEISTPLSISASGNPYANNCFITLEEGKSYMFKISISRPCLSAALYMNYYDIDGQYITVNKEIGGMRISKVIAQDNNGVESIKKYYYGNFDCLECSSASMENIRPAISFFTTKTFTSPEPLLLIESRSTTVNLSSTTLHSLYDSQGYHIRYKTVIEGLGENFEGGAVLHKYNIVTDEPPVNLIDPVIGTPYTNGFGNGQELQQITHKNKNGSLLKVSKVDNIYVKDNRLQNSIDGFKTSLRRSTNGNYYNLSKYYLNTEWHYLQESISTQYYNDEQDSISIHNKYYYDNEDHLQLTKSETTDSEGNLIKTQLTYPSDCINGEISEATKNAMETLHMIAPVIKKEIVKNEGLINGQITKYDIFPENNNRVYPEQIKKLKGSEYETKTNFDKYDPSGNLLQYHKENDIFVSFIWSYNNTYPVIKAENCTFDNLENAIESLSGSMTAFHTLLANVGDMTTTTQRSQWKTFNDNLRANALLENAMPSTYTYKPLVGMTSATDPAGQTTYYEYDDFNRLSIARNQDGDILQKTDYHYYGLPFLDADIESRTVSADGGSFTVNISTNTPYNVSNDSGGWVTTTVNGNQVSISCSANPTTAQRIATVTFSGEGLTEQLVITQEAMQTVYLNADFSYVVDLVNIGEAFLVPVTSNAAWTAYCSETGWISISPSSGSNNATITITCIEDMYKNLTLYISNSYGTTLTCPIKIRPSMKPPAL